MSAAGSGVAACGARAATEAADHWVPGPEHALGPAPMDRRFCARLARIWLDRRSHHRDRVSLGGGTQRAFCRDCSRIRSAQRRYHCHVLGRAGAGGKTGDIHHSNRLPCGPDPLGSGLVASLARPGGNVTGFSTQSTDLPGKRLEFLREVVPGLRWLGIMANRRQSGGRAELREVQAAARGSASRSQISKFSAPRILRPPLRLSRVPREALYVCAEPLVNVNRIRINNLARARDYRLFTASVNTWRQEACCPMDQTSRTSSGAPRAM